MENILKNKKLILFITTLQEAFTAIIPFFLIISFAQLIFFFLQYIGIELSSLKNLINTFNLCSSIVAIIAISYFFSIRFKTSTIIAPILSIASFISVSLLFESPDNVVVLPSGFNIQTIIIPIVSTYLLKFFYPYFNLKIPLNYGHQHVYKLFNYLFVFVIAYLTTLSLYFICDYILDYILEIFNSLNFHLSTIIKVIFRELFVQLFWFFGIHGDHTVNALFTKTILFQELAPHLTVSEFLRLFVNIGGSGIGLSMLIALFLYMKDNTLRLIAKISTPFVIFNINTLLIYAIVVLNRFLIIPFLTLPILNAVLAYIFIKITHITFSTYTIPWTTPIFIDAYIKSHGNINVILFQLFLLTLDTLVYIYFIKKFSSSKDLLSKFKLLEKNLDITTEIEAKETIQAFKARGEIIEASAKLDNILNSLNKNNLFVYYQPKVDIQHNRCNKFEALIRYQNNGKLTGPTFLDIIEEARLAPIIDIWVCNKVKEHLKIWKNEDFYPMISINLHPDTLASTDAINKIIKILYGEKIMFEIIERSLIHQNALDNLNKLQQNNFKISIDDYGTGYSNLQSIITLKIDELKIDKSLIDQIETHKGLLVSIYITNLCHDLDIKVVAEGVETKSQYTLVKNTNIDIVQGYYFSAAKPYTEIKKLANKFSS